jgi:hypothetical protein
MQTPWMGEEILREASSISKSTDPSESFAAMTVNLLSIVDLAVHLAFSDSSQSR